MVEFVGLKNPVRGDPIDLTKPCETDETPSRPVRVLATDVPGGQYPVVAVIDGHVRTFALDGRQNINFTGGITIRNVSTKPEVVRHEAWVALYRDGTCGRGCESEAELNRMFTQEGRVETRKVVWNSDGSPVEEDPAALWRLRNLR